MKTGQVMVRDELLLPAPIGRRGRAATAASASLAAFFTADTVSSKYFGPASHSHSSIACDPSPAPPSGVGSRCRRRGASPERRHGPPRPWRTSSCPGPGSAGRRRRVRPPTSTPRGGPPGRRVPSVRARATPRLPIRSGGAPFGLIEPSGGVRSRVSSSSPANSPRFRSEAMTPPSLAVQLDRRAEGRVARLLVLEVADDLERARRRRTALASCTVSFTPPGPATDVSLTACLSSARARPQRVATIAGPDQSLRPNPHVLLPRRIRDRDPQNAQHPQPSPHDDPRRLGARRAGDGRRSDARAQATGRRPPASPGATATRW